jgi:hypothetical protein
MRKKFSEFIDDNFDDLETFLSLALLSMIAGYFVTRLIWSLL